MNSLSLSVAFEPKFAIFFLPYRNLTFGSEIRVPAYQGYGMYVDTVDNVCMRQAYHVREVCI